MVVDDFGFYLVLWILAMGFVVVVVAVGCGCDGWLSWLLVVVTGGDEVVFLFLFFFVLKISCTVF